MKQGLYKKQAALLLSVLPEIAKENSFALHGGTAINLFVRDLLRLSVDIDLTYVPIEDRVRSLTNIGAALDRIQAEVIRAIPGIHVANRKDIGKLLFSQPGADVKLEVNLVGRGTLDSPKELPLCTKAQEEFDAFCAIPVMPFGQLFGGKICAALDRQHPRDLFDVKYLLQHEGFSEQVKRGFLFCLLGSNRPFHEILAPHPLDQRDALENQFSGMSAEEFTYDEYESVRQALIEAVRENLTENDKQFLLSINGLKPDWGIYDFERFPAIKWKLLNLQKLSENDSEKYRRQFEALKKTLDEF